MTLKCIILIQYIIYCIFLWIKTITCTIIVTDQPIINATMYIAYPDLFTLDMSNQTEFEFPVEQVLLIHDELSRFVCNNCGVHSIYQVSLSQLPQLTHLMMENNTLQYIHQDAFEHNTRLEKVSLVGNQLSTFNPEATIRHIPGLTLLDLSWNEQFDLNRVDLQGTRLIIFTCNHCNTSYLDQKTLSNMPRLSQLGVSYNGLEQIDDNALMLSKYMKILDVDGNTDLQRLSLKSTSLVKMSAEGCSLGGTLTTSKLPMLESINVRANRIARVDEFGFLQNPNITEVLLDDNLIQKVPTDLLRLPLNGLKRLCLDGNLLQPGHHVDEAKTLYSARSLRKDCLDDGNHLKKFENYLRFLSGRIVYKKHPIHELINYGTTVDLSNNDIVYIEPDYLIDEQNVTEVLFDSNHLFDFHRHRTFLTSSRIERISLNNCSITEIYESTFKELPRLKFLHLQGNKIKYIDSGSLFVSNSDLTILNLSDNLLEFIYAQSFTNMTSLEVLQLDRNRYLTNRPHTPFLYSTSLSNFSCNHCQFDGLDTMTLKRLPDLQELKLEYNYITTVDSDALQSTTKLKHLNLRHNPLVVFAPNLNQLSNLTTLCLDRYLDLEHDRHMHLLDDVPKLKQLNKNCGDEVFEDKLVRLYQQRNKARYQINDSTTPKSQPLESFETSSAAAHGIYLLVPSITVVLSYSISVLRLYGLSYVVV